MSSNDAKNLKYSMSTSLQSLTLRNMINFRQRQVQQQKLTTWPAFVCENWPRQRREVETLKPCRGTARIF